MTVAFPTSACRKAREETTIAPSIPMKKKYWRFISPEVCFNGEKAEEVFKDNVYIK